MLAALKSLNPGLEEATSVTEAMADREEAMALRRHLGVLMAEPLYEIVMHIVRQYPDLDPDVGFSPPRE